MIDEMETSDNRRSGSIVSDDGSIPEIDGVKRNPDQWEDRMLKCRERNREHAKKTRLRKKMGLDGMKQRLLELQNEASQLQQQLEESNTANILLHLSHPGTYTQDLTKETDRFAQFATPLPHQNFSTSLSKGNIIDHIRSSIRAETAAKNQHLFDTSPTSARLTNSPKTSPKQNEKIATLTLPPAESPIPHPRSRLDSISAESEFEDIDIDEEDSSVISNHTDTADLTNTARSAISSTDSPHSHSLDPKSDEFHVIRKERNRIHAKLTRDRKKLFTSRMQQMITSLERQNNIMKYRLMRNAAAASSSSSSSSSSTQAMIPPIIITTTTAPSPLLTTSSSSSNLSSSSSYSGSTIMETMSIPTSPYHIQVTSPTSSSTTSIPYHLQTFPHMNAMPSTHHHHHHGHSGGHHYQQQHLSPLPPPPTTTTTTTGTNWTDHSISGYNSNSSVSSVSSCSDGYQMYRRP